MRRCLRIALFASLVTSFTALSFLTGYGTSFLLHPGTEQARALEREEQFGVFWEAWRVAQENFYGSPVDNTRLTYGAIRGAIRTLDDPFTWFADPLMSERIREDATGRYSGIGSVVNLNEPGYVVIVRPFAGGPADKAGLMAGDLILEIDGLDTKELSLDEAVSMIRGVEGTAVRLTIQREGLDSPFQVEVVRAEIEIPSVEYRTLDQGIAYLKLNDFHARAPAGLHSALAALLAEQPRALILDLRDNPGGLLSSAIDIGSEFIAEGSIVSERGSNGLEETHMSRGNGLATTIPLVVLVNGGTASAAEIVAGAVQDHERGVLIGEHTFGKGAVQSPIDLSDGSHLRLTIAHWFTPNGHLIQEGGIAPDIEVGLTDEDAVAGLDPQLDRAVSYLLANRQ